MAWPVCLLCLCFLTVLLFKGVRLFVVSRIFLIDSDALKEFVVFFSSVFVQ